MLIIMGWEHRCTILSISEFHQGMESAVYHQVRESLVSQLFRFQAQDGSILMVLPNIISCTRSIKDYHLCQSRLKILVCQPYRLSLTPYLCQLLLKSSAQRRASRASLPLLRHRLCSSRNLLQARRSNWQRSIWQRSPMKRTLSRCRTIYCR